MVLMLVWPFLPYVHKGVCAFCKPRLQFPCCQTHRARWNVATTIIISFISGLIELQFDIRTMSLAIADCFLCVFLWQSSRGRHHPPQSENPKSAENVSNTKALLCQCSCAGALRFSQHQFGCKGASIAPLSPNWCPQSALGFSLLSSQRKGAHRVSLHRVAQPTFVCGSVQQSAYLASLVGRGLA